MIHPKTERTRVVSGYGPVDGVSSSEIHQALSEAVVLRDQFREESQALGIIGRSDLIAISERWGYRARALAQRAQMLAA